MRRELRSEASLALINKGNYKYLYWDEIEALRNYFNNDDSLKIELGLTNDEYLAFAKQTPDNHRPNWKYYVAAQIAKLGTEPKIDLNLKLAKQFKVSLQYIYIIGKRYGWYAEDLFKRRQEWLNRDDYDHAVKRLNEHAVVCRDERLEERYSQGCNFEAGDQRVYTLELIRKKIARIGYSKELDSILAHELHVKPFKITAFRHFNKLFPEKVEYIEQNFYHDEISTFLIFCFVRRAFANKRKSQTINSISLKEGINEFINENPFSIKGQSSIYRKIGQGIKDLQQKALKVRTYTVFLEDKNFIDVDVMLGTNAKEDDLPLNENMYRLTKRKRSFVNSNIPNSH